MKDGDVLLTSLPQADGTMKDRPVLLLCRVPPFDDFLVCGISTQLQQAAPELDEQIAARDPDYRTSGLKSVSLIRLEFLAVLPRLQKERLHSPRFALFPSCADSVGRKRTTTRDVRPPGHAKTGKARAV
jgi:mRNA interferase MazF